MAERRGNRSQRDPLLKRFQKRTDETRSALREALRSESCKNSESLTAAAKHAYELAVQIPEIQNDLSKPGSVSIEDPRTSQRKQMFVINGILIAVDRDLQAMAEAKVDTIYKSSINGNERITRKVVDIKNALRVSGNSVEAASDALSTEDSNEQIFKTRARLRSQAIDSLAEVEKQLSALGDAFTAVARNVAKDEGNSAGPSRTG